MPRAVVGAIPAAGSAIAVAVSYAQEQRPSENPEAFGKGAPEGIVAPEAANNAGVAGAMLSGCAWMPSSVACNRGNRSSFFGIGLDFLCEGSVDGFVARQGDRCGEAARL